MLSAKKILTTLIFTAMPVLAHAEPVFTIETRKHQAVFTRSELEKMKIASQLTISNNRAYPRKTMTYKVVKLCELLQPYAVDKKEMLEFVATDKFVVLIPASKIMSCGKDDAIAYLAIEPKEKWPLLDEKYGKNVTAGPFDVIWTLPAGKIISDEYWAWSVVAVKSHAKLDEKVFQTAPTVTDPAQQARLTRGYDVYISHCAGCHTMNNIGKGHVGMDLNIPKSAVEYYPDDAVLKKFIRDPQAVHRLPKRIMSGTKADTLPDADLNDMIYYFHYMANEKNAASSPSQ